MSWSFWPSAGDISFGDTVIRGCSGNGTIEEGLLVMDIPAHKAPARGIQNSASRFYGNSPAGVTSSQRDQFKAARGGLLRVGAEVVTCRRSLAAANI